MKRITATLCLTLATIYGIAQQITYEQYMQNVINNTLLMAQSIGIEIAQANLKNSKIYNDPTLSVEYGNNEDWDKKLGYSIGAELSRKFTFGVRRAAINLANKEMQAATAVFNDYMRNFHADATIAYLTHLRAKALLETAAKREKYMQQLSESDSLRFVRGDIAKTSWIEAQLAASLAHNERLTAEAEYRNTAIILGYYMGNLKNAEQITATGNLEECSTPIKEPDYYIEKALMNRADLTAAISKVDIAEAQKRLGSARRRIDIQLSVGAEYNKGAHRNTPEDPSFTKLKVGASIPMKFSNLNRGAKAMEAAKVEQAQNELADTRLRIQSEVIQAYNNCNTAQMQINTFTRKMLADVAELLKSKRKAYQAGEISFVEFIETERSDNLIQEEYINALFNNAVSRVELLRSIGISKE
ncbi:MAG: TolC family protein [Bacteroidaceae bacterium]|nr:TolC family protein [Bacteroidaceae bacterium]